MSDLPGFLLAHDLPALSAGATSELAAVVDELADPGKFLALSSGDPCPGNDALTPQGIRFFDFEAAVFRHALADAAHYRIPFPNCWCWRILPEAFRADLTDIYRASFATGCPEALETERFDSSLASMAAAWFIWTLFRRLPIAAADKLEQQRIATAASGFLMSASKQGNLPQIATWVDCLARSSVSSLASASRSHLSRVRRPSVQPAHLAVADRYLR